MHNPHEPEAQWSSKSTTKDKPWVGYKAQVASEQQTMGLEPPSGLYVDGAYVSSEALKAARDENRELRGPAPASPDRGKVFTVEAFDVHVEERYAVCPGGQRSGNCSRLEEQTTGKVVYRIEWSNTVCGACPLRAQCVVAGQDHRTFVVGELHSLLQERRREMQTIGGDNTRKRDRSFSKGAQGAGRTRQSTLNGVPPGRGTVWAEAFSAESNIALPHADSAHNPQPRTLTTDYPARRNRRH